ncbi:MAG: hypothetical protein ABJ246_11120 [Paracoccaceae bacterium]
MRFVTHLIGHPLGWQILDAPFGELCMETNRRSVLIAKGVCVFLSRQGLAIRLPLDVVWTPSQWPEHRAWLPDRKDVCLMYVVSATFEYAVPVIFLYETRMTLDEVNQ